MISFNGISSASLSYNLTDLSGWMDGPAFSRATASPLGLMAQVPGAYGTTAARQINMRGRLQCNSLADRKTKLSALTDATANKVELIFDDKLGQYVYARRMNLVVTERAPQGHLTLFDVFVSMNFLAEDPVSYDIEPRVVSFTSTPAAIEVGTLPSAGVLYITGSLSTLTSRVITYRSINGIVYGTLTLTPPSGESLGANDFVVLSLAHPGTIYKVSAGVIDDVYDWKSAGSWFMPMPEDCDRTQSAYPTLEIDSGAATYVYVNAWAL